MENKNGILETFWSGFKKFVLSPIGNFICFWILLFGGLLSLCLVIAEFPSINSCYWSFGCGAYFILILDCLFYVFRDLSKCDSSGKDPDKNENNDI